MKYYFEKLILFFNLKTLNSLIGFIYGQFFPPRKSYSQFGEDLIINNYFKKINCNHGYYLDIGAYHPKFISNTYLLHKNGWRGTCVDLDQDKLKWFKFSRQNKVQTICAAINDNENFDSVKFFKHKRILS